MSSSLRASRSRVSEDEVLKKRKRYDHTLLLAVVRPAVEDVAESSLAVNTRALGDSLEAGLMGRWSATPFRKRTKGRSAQAHPDAVVSEGALGVEVRDLFPSQRATQSISPSAITRKGREGTRDALPAPPPISTGSWHVRHMVWASCVLPVRNSP